MLQAPADSLLGRLALVAQPGRPWLRVTVSARWARILIAAGAKAAPTVDTTVVTFRSEPHQVGDQVGDSRESFHEQATSSGSVGRRKGRASEEIENTSRPSIFAVPRLGRFVLPLPPEPGAVAAAGRGERAIVRAQDADGQLEYLLHRANPPELDYKLEVLLRAFTDLPTVVTVWYHGSRERTERTLFIPVTHAPFGPPSSMVRLSNFDPGAPWYGSAPVAAARVQTWDPTVVRASVAAAANESTFQAWRDVTPLVDEDVRQLILTELP